MTEQEKAYRYWYVNIPGLKPKSRQRLLENIGTAKDIYHLSKTDVFSILEETQAQALWRGKESWDVATEYEKLIAHNIGFTAYGMPDYPLRLLHIPSPPQALYYKGKLPKDNRPAVAIVGARMCSEYGSYVAKEFGSKLAVAGIQIISGLAMGIDGISQMAAVEMGADSYGVLGCGVDICYPKSNQKLYDKLLLQGGILSEFTPGTKPKAQHFPARNRIISGLADLVLVIEAKEKSGTSITVDMALEQGREVYAVPGRITDALSAGCHKLIKQGAGIAATPEDIIAALYYEETALQQTRKIAEAKAQKKIDTPEAQKKIDTPEAEFGEKRKQFYPQFSEKERSIWECLDRWPQSMQDIHDKRKHSSNHDKNTGQASCTIQETMEILMNLCLKGFAEMRNGGYVKNDNFL